MGDIVGTATAVVSWVVENADAVATATEGAIAVAITFLAWFAS